VISVGDGSPPSGHRGGDPGDRSPSYTPMKLTVCWTDFQIVQSIDRKRLIEFGLWGFDKLMVDAPAVTQ
jgi:hypothetical protein